MKQLITFLLVLASLHVLAKELSVSSPDGCLSATVSIGQKISYSVSLNGEVLISPSFISMQIDDTELGVDPKLKKSFMEPMLQSAKEQVFK